MSSTAPSNLPSATDTKDLPKPTLDTDTSATTFNTPIDPTIAVDDTPTRPGQVERFTTAPTDVPTLAAMSVDQPDESSKTVGETPQNSSQPSDSPFAPQAATTDGPTASTTSKPKLAPLDRSTTTAIGPAVDTPTTPSAPLAISHFASLPQTSDDRNSPSDTTELTGVSSSLPSVTENGPGADESHSHTEAHGSATSSDMPAVMITLLLQSGARHPFKLDGKYLARRNVGADVTTAGSNDGASEGKESKDPWTISVYTVKELILRDWRDEWEAKPMSPSSIRLIHFGKMLDDKTILKDLNFNANTANVVHMTVKPAETFDEEDAGKTGKTGRRRGNHGMEGDVEGGSSAGCCRCCTVM